MARLVAPGVASGCRRGFDESGLAGADRCGSAVKSTSVHSAACGQAVSLANKHAYGARSRFKSVKIELDGIPWVVHWSLPARLGHRAGITASRLPGELSGLRIDVRGCQSSADGCPVRWRRGESKLSQGQSCRAQKAPLWGDCLNWTVETLVHPSLITNTIDLPQFPCDFEFKMARLHQASPVLPRAMGIYG